MRRKKIIKISLIVVLAIIVIAGGTAFYLFNMPHRDVQQTKTDFAYTSNEIVDEYLKDPEAANQKYLDEEGESKIFEVTGNVAEISTDFNGQKVVLLQSEGSPAGVSCTFPKDLNEAATNFEVGKTITVKGVIRAGAGYNEALEMYENVILDKCSIITSK
jgi:hypothetical protein